MPRKIKNQRIKNGTFQFISQFDSFSHRKQSFPSTFLSEKYKHQAQKPSKDFTYDRDILCLPQTCGKTVPIPRSKEMRDILAKNGLIGKVRLLSSMKEKDIMKEIRSVFEVPMRGKEDFPFHILQPSGGNSKSLSIPALSSSFQWTASAVAGKNSKTPIYILAQYIV